MRPERHAGWAARVAAVAVTCTVGSFALSACGSAGPALALQACVHVDASIRLYHEAEHTRNPSTARREAVKATDQLAQAEPLAARATSADPAFNPLMTTLQENGRTSESNLIPALRAQCAAARNPTGQGGFGTAPTSNAG